MTNKISKIPQRSSAKGTYTTEQITSKITKKRAINLYYRTDN